MEQSTILLILWLLFLSCIIYLIWNMDFGLDSMLEQWAEEDKKYEEKMKEDR